MGHLEDLYRDLCENANDLIQSVDGEGRFLYVNRAWLATLNYTREETTRLSVFDVIHPDSRDHCREVFQQLTDGESSIFIETVFQSKDGRSIPVEGSASCRFEKGEMASTRGIFRDVSKRKRTEEELEKLFQVSQDLLCVAGTDGFFRHINPAFERVLGYSADELLERPFVDFVHPDDRDQTLTEVGNLAKGLPTVDFENRYKAKDGSLLWLSWRATSMPGQGLIYAVARDITKLKHDQELLARQAVELERSNADLEQFAYVASHDLRAPLRSIASLSEWLAELVPREAGSKIHDYLSELRVRVRRLETMTDDLLSYARAGRGDEETTEVDTGAMARDLVFMLNPPEGLEVDVDPSLPVLDTARAPLEQVFRNLIGNAIKHHDRPEEGRIKVSAVERDGVVEFSIADDGPGIPAESHDKVFGMFQKLESRDIVEGNGIGLSLVQRIVEGREGRITLESEGRGVIFRFTWPEGGS
jgi:PAS domain S-box-containing protein